MWASPQELLQNARSLASPPIVYQRLVEVMNHPRSGSSDIARVISEDPALTARLLKLVNSALFSFPQRIGTVSHAVQVVGTAQIRDLALATSIMSVFKDVPSDLVDMKSFWRHSFACGIGARVLAHHRREGNIERFFVSGLLHDIGRLVLFLTDGDASREAVQLARNAGRSLTDTEQEVFGFDHAQVGGALLEKWNFPGHFRDAVAYHHNPIMASRFPLEAATVHVADLIANAMELGSSGTLLVPALVEGAWRSLSLDPVLTPLILDELERQYTDATQVALGTAA